VKSVKVQRGRRTRNEYDKKIKKQKSKSKMTIQNSKRFVVRRKIVGPRFLTTRDFTDSFDGSTSSPQANLRINKLSAGRLRTGNTDLF
jgi:hypothetical protein